MEEGFDGGVAARGSSKNAPRWMRTRKAHLRGNLVELRKNRGQGIDEGGGDGCVRGPLQIREESEGEGKNWG